MLSKDKCEATLSKLYDEMRKMEQHPSYPFVDEIPGYRFVSEEIDHFENLLAEWDDRG